ncbi:MAG: hypothetical protein CM15mP93_04580 [Thiotrichaceae bacterium]|nr:MAG: hypothetical protein CM15mP93_04580 [Thiotrichaceae bacterium]
MMLNNTLNYDAPSNTKIILTILSWVTPQITSILALIIKKIFFKKSKRYKVSMINLKICFPEKSDDWLEKWLAQAWASLQKQF